MPRSGTPVPAARPTPLCSCGQHDNSQFESQTYTGNRLARCATKWAWLRPPCRLLSRPRRVPCASTRVRVGGVTGRVAGGHVDRRTQRKRTEFVSAIWELDPAGKQPARRLTRGVKGESSPEFTADGDLLFVAARPTEDDDKPPASLWRLPAAGGEAVEELALPGGIDAVRAARAAAAIVVAAKLMRSAASADQDKRLRTLRKDNKVSAVMHSGYPVRYWDHDLGPDRPHLLDVGGPRDLTPQPGDALGEADFDVSSDGTFVVTSWHDPAPGASIRGTLVRIDLATAQRATVADDPDADLEHPTISPDGTAVAFIRETHSTPDKAPRITLCHMRSVNHSSN